MALPEADHYNVNSLRQWLSNDDNTNINGPGANTWGDLDTTRSNSRSVTRALISLLRSMVWPRKPTKSRLNLIVPRAGLEYDGLTKWVANEWTPFWQCVEDS